MAAESRSADETLASTVVRVSGPDGLLGGAGALVAPDLVLTCAHVVSDALGLPRHEKVAPGAVVTVDFPLAGLPANGAGNQRGTLDAEVEHWIPIRPDRTGDIAALRLRTSLPDARPLPMADPESVWEHGARAVGFTGGEPGETWFRGKFSGSTSEGWIQLSRADGQAAHVKRGFSGSPVWDNELDAAVGLMVAAQPERDAQQAFVLSTKTLLREIPGLAPVILPAAPFRGLATYRETDADVFFGRDDDIDDVVTALRGDHPTVTVYGPSGSGKSSLALAGVVPRMRRAGYDVLVVNAGQISSPRSALATELYEAVRSGRYGLPARAGSAEQVEAWLADRGLADAYHRARGKASGGLVVVLDQAEALLDRTEAEVTEAADLLFPGRQPAGVRVLVTLRADFMDAMLKHPRLGPALRGGKTLPLTPMSRAQLDEVIVKPLDRIPAVTYDPGLDRRILDDARDEPGILPLLGFVLEQLWEQRAAGRLRSATYEAMGGVSGALELHARRVWQECVDEQDEAEALRLLTGLVRVHPGSETPLRRRLTREEAGETRWRLARSFAERRLLVLHGGEEEPETAELAHEALITAWPALRRQVKADGEFLAGRAELVHDHDRWERGGRSADLLPGGQQLAAIGSRLGGREQELTEEERAFLALARQRHRARRTRTRIAWTAAALVLALIAGLGTFLVHQSSVSEQREAEARSRSLAGLSGELVKRDPGQAALAALAAYDIAPTQEARSALMRRYDQFKDAEWVLTGAEGKIKALAMSLDGAVTLVTTETGGATLFVRTGGKVLRKQLQPRVKALAPMVSGDGRRIAYVAQGDGGLVRHDVAPGAKDAEHVLGTAESIPAGGFKAVDGSSRFGDRTGLAAISPDGRRAVAVADDKRLWLWDLETRRNRRLPVDGPAVEKVWFGPAPNTLVGQRRGPSSQESTMVAIDIGTGKTRELADRASTDGGAALLGLSGDGGVLVVCRRGGTVSESTYRAVRVADGRELHRYDVKSSCRGPAIDARGERYAVFEVGGWQLVDTRRGRKVRPFSAPKPPLLTNLPLLGSERDPVLVTWDDTAVTGTELGMDSSSIDSPPVLIDGGRKMLAHLGRRGESVGLLDTSEGLTDATGRLRILAEAKRDLSTAPTPSEKLIVNAAETLVADRTGRNEVMIRELPSLRRATELTTAPPPPTKDGGPDRVEFLFLTDDELVTVSGTRIEHWDARNGRRLSPPFDVGDLGLSKSKQPKFVLDPHPEPDHVQIMVDGGPTMYAVNVRTGRETKALRLRLGHDVVNAVLDGSGRYAAAKTRADMVELWTVRPGERPERVIGPLGPLNRFRDNYQAGFLRGSSDFFLANGNSVRVLRPADPARGDSYDFEKDQTFLAASRNGKVLLRYTRDGNVDMFRLDPGIWKKHVCKVLGRDLDAAEWNGFAVGPPSRVCPA
ncbi:nSTAND1 domain-containing NTPase [Streptomyces syringium]|uniref:nSTAND1 domain-containing NTPase n=1 Tax=Streptomyces syringium TaxID=76729 RepID=UPI0033CFA07F